MNTQPSGELHMSRPTDRQQQPSPRASGWDGKAQNIEVCGRGIKIQGRFLRIARLSGEKYKFLEDAEGLLDGLRKCEMRIDLFTFVQRLTHTSPKYSYPMEWDNFAVLPVSTFGHWWEHQIGFKARNKAKQAEKKGVTVREVPFGREFVEGIWQVYSEARVRQGKPNVHYGKDISTVFKEEATHLDSSIFIGAFFSGRLIGFVKLVTDETRTQAGLMNIVSMVQHRDKAPTNALVAQAVRSCAERGISYLVYSNFAYGKKERDSLSDFKERNGFQRIEVPRYYVPLTRVGRFALRFGLHHKLSDHVPELVASRLRRLRAAWYSHKFQSEARPVKDSSPSSVSEGRL